MGNGESTMKKVSMGFALALALLTGLVNMASAGPPERHLRLLRSEPAADSTVTASPAELKMYWTEVPRLPVTAVRLTTVSEQPVALGEPRADEADAKILHVPVTAALAPGVYTVTWRTAGNDGHILNGSYTFTYRPAR
jgi:methionine-rich copper-binding protein CopC